MSDIEGQIYGHYLTALEKFDYFILGVVVVVCGFLSKEIDFQPIGRNIETIQLFSLILFGIAGFSSFKRSEHQISQYKYNYMLLANKKKEDLQAITVCQNRLLKIMGSSNKYYSVRNFCLLMGFFVYISSKVFGPYIGS